MKSIKISKFFFVKNFTENFKKNIKKIKFFLNRNLILVLKLRFYLLFLTKSLSKLINSYKLNWVILIEKSLTSINYISIGTKKNLERNLRFNTYIEIATKGILKKINLLNLNEFYLNKYKVYQLFNLKYFINFKEINQIINYSIYYYSLTKKYKFKKINNLYLFSLLKNLKKNIFINIFYINLNSDKYKYILKNFFQNNKIDFLFFIYKIFLNQLLLNKNKTLLNINLFLQKYFLKKFQQILKKKQLMNFFFKKFLKNKQNLILINGYLMVCSGRIRNQRKKSKLFFYKGKLLRSSIVIPFNYLNETAFTKNGSFGLKIYKSFEKVNILKLKQKILQNFHKLNIY